MKTIYIYCEGPTEESFINAVLYPYFLGMGDRKSTRLNFSHNRESRMPSSA